MFSKTITLSVKGNAIHQYILNFNSEHDVRKNLTVAYTLILSAQRIYLITMPTNNINI